MVFWAFQALGVRYLETFALQLQSVGQDTTSLRRQETNRLRTSRRTRLIGLESQRPGIHGIQVNVYIRWNQENSELIKGHFYKQGHFHMYQMLHLCT